MFFLFLIIEISSPTKIFEKILKSGGQFLVDYLIILITYYTNAHTERRMKCQKLL